MPSYPETEFPPRRMALFFLGVWLFVPPIALLTLSHLGMLA